MSYQLSNKQAGYFYGMGLPFITITSYLNQAALKLYFGLLLSVALVLVLIDAFGK